MANTATDVLGNVYDRATNQVIGRTDSGQKVDQQGNVYGSSGDRMGTATPEQIKLAGMTPLTAGQVPQPMNTLTSEDATNNLNDVSSDIQQRQADVAEQTRKYLAQQLAAQEQGINANFQTRERQLKVQQGEEQATSAATQFRLGRSATPFADAEKQKLNQMQTDQLNELTGQREALLSQARAAATKGNIDLANSLIEQDSQLFNRQMAIQKEQRERNAQETDLQMKKANFDMDQKDFLTKQEDRAAKYLSTNLISLDENGELVYPSSDEILEYAEQSNIDPNVLLSYVNSRSEELKKISREERKSALDQKRTEADIARTEFLTEKDKKMLPNELYLQQLDVSKRVLDIQKTQKELREAEKTVGNLNDAELTALDKTKETENLKLLRELKVSIDTYKKQIEKFGAASISPGQKKMLNSAYAETINKWKEAARLGALTGPDMQLAEAAIPDVTADGFFGSIGGLIGNATGTGGRALATIEEKLKQIDTEASTNYDNLVRRNQKYEQSDYVRSLGAPFKGEDFYVDYFDFTDSAPAEKLEDFQNQLKQAGIDENDTDKVKEAFMLYNLPK